LAFSTTTGGQLWAVSRSATQVLQQTQLNAALATSAHTYRIERTGTTAVYKIDGIVVATHVVAGTAPAAPVGARDGVLGGVAMALQWMRVTPYASTGTWTSAVVDGLAPVAWGSLVYTAAAGTGTITVQTRTGTTLVPGATWTGWTTRATGANVGATSRYLQFRVTMTPTPGTTAQTPVLSDVTVNYGVV
jgi:hypothetical protein